MVVQGRSRKDNNELRPPHPGIASSFSKGRSNENDAVDPDFHRDGKGGRAGLKPAPTKNAERWFGISAIHP